MWTGFQGERNVDWFQKERNVDWFPEREKCTLFSRKRDVWTGFQGEMLTGFQK